MSNFSLEKVQALLAKGLLRMLFDPRYVEDYWDHMLREYPDHPAKGRKRSAVPLSLYGVLT